MAGREGGLTSKIHAVVPHLVRSVTIVSSGTLSPRVGTNDVAPAQPRGFSLGTEV
jgi:hypothetical protein